MTVLIPSFGVSVLCILPASKRWQRWGWRWVESLPWPRAASTSGTPKRSHLARAEKRPRTEPWNREVKWKGNIMKFPELMSYSAKTPTFPVILLRSGPIWSSFCTPLHNFKDLNNFFQNTYLEFPTSSYKTWRHLWGLVMLLSVSGCQVGKADVFSSGVGVTLLLYWANLTTAVTVASMVSNPIGTNPNQQVSVKIQHWNTKTEHCSQTWGPCLVEEVFIRGLRLGEADFCTKQALDTAFCVQDYVRSFAVSSAVRVDLSATVSNKTGDFLLD